MSMFILDTKLMQMYEYVDPGSIKAITLILQRKQVPVITSRVAVSSRARIAYILTGAQTSGFAASLVTTRLPLALPGYLEGLPHGTGAFDFRANFSSFLARSGQLLRK